ncbi:phosphorylcholine transferase LicD [uncultured Eubacterium sp.]|uniref:LicD family protein n=1 Tax=uncultured Eubacterium sp. TaxID=165185 RepID=UPI0025937095|nr:LicD family protein [uncultured Eubacterium sp.]
MSELQKKLLDMLKWFDKICEENNISYYAIGGTMLGAARHNGFIPWDDDLDVGLPREEYEKLSDIMTNNQEERYILETVNSEDKEYCYTFSKIYDTETILIENVKSKFVRGIYIDVFPIDGLGSAVEPDYSWYNKINRRKQFFLARITGIRKGRSLIKNAAVIFARLIPEILIDNRELRINIDRMCQKYEYKKSTWVANLLGNWGKKEIVPITYFGEPKKYRFEDIEISGVEKPDEYLTHVYGDWRKLPSIDKQVSHHDYVYINLRKSYKRK